MKRIPIAVIATALSMCAVMYSCSIDEKRINDQNLVEAGGREVPADAFEQGKVRLLLTEDLASRLELKSDSAGVLLNSGVKSVDDAAASLGIVRMERTFPYAGKFEPRTRKEGLHLWYDVYFDDNVPLTRAGDELSSIPGVRTVEYRPKVVRLDGKIVPGTLTSSPDLSSVQNSKAADVFNDPMLGDQWHYYNDGSMPRSVAGADINVLPMWERGFVGSSEVIVSVVDGGIDYTHEDLADNMWVNPEMSNPDESHGYNFVRGNYKLTFDDHGTHVAGTISAVNNNGIGVCGVAGGDKANGIPGVRLMSCQIFEGMTGGDGVAAIKWGADHGAVISQNSWGYELRYINKTPESDKAAIDYFVKYAGFDENGNQTGPMAGGLVVFAAGNDAVNVGYPSDYENCVAVSAIAGDYTEAYYTNYGDWVDIAAPGGDEFKNHLVISTVPDNKYAGFQGTSMACPHVSGVAALLVSYLGGPGFTCDVLRDLLENSARDISAYTDPAKYMGVGLVDVEKAFYVVSDVAPEPLTEFSASAHSNFIDFTLVVPADEDGPDGAPVIATLHYSKSSFDPEDSLAVNDLPCYEMPLSGVKPGDEVSGSAGGLEFNTDYYVSASVRDFSRNRSKLYPTVIKLRTGDNTPPEFVPGEDIDTTVAYFEVLNIDIQVDDPDGHIVIPSITSCTGVSVSLMEGNVLRVTMDGSRMKEDEGTLLLKVSDGYGGEDSMNINYRVIRNFPPEVGDAPTDVVLSIPSSETQLLDLTEYFSDRDGDQLVYSVENSSESVVTASVQHNTLVLTASSLGAASVKVTAFDRVLDTASVVFNVVVRDAGRLADFYPNPMTDVLNVRTGMEVTGASLKLRDAYGNTRISKDNLNISPSAPAVVDVSALAGGIYSATLSWKDGDGEERSVTVNVAKL